MMSRPYARQPSVLLIAIQGPPNGGSMYRRVIVAGASGP
jgi:hypothetical protein